MKLEITLKILINLLFIFPLISNADVVGSVASCNKALEQGNTSLAISRADDAIKQSPNHHQALLCKGRALGATGQYSEALKTLELAQKNTTDEFDLIISAILIGNLHKSQQHTPEAIANYQKSMQLCETSKNQKFTRITHNLMAEAYTQAGNHTSALEHYEAGSKLANNDNERADSYERLADTYLSLGKFDAAIEHQLKGVMMQKKAGTPDQFAVATMTLGQIYAQAKDDTNAEKSYNKLIDFAKENGGAYYEARGKLLLANLKMKQDQAVAKTLLQDAQKIAKTVGDAELSRDIDTAIKNMSN